MSIIVGGNMAFHTRSVGNSEWNWIDPSSVGFEPVE